MQIERLEDRTVPVLGANGFGTVVPRGGDFDGVVNLFGCTGSLLWTRLEVLTAAHCVDATNDMDTIVDGPSTVRFELIRDGNPINIDINTPTNLTFLHPGWNDNLGNGNDLAIFRLTDQVTPAVNRRLVAPAWAQGYNLFTGNPLGQNFTVVGYGETGNGNTGQQSNEVQRVTINNPSGGTFTLTFNNQTTGPINEGSTSQQVAAALALANIGTGNVAVNNENLPANTWDVRFIGIGGNQPQITGTGSGGSTVAVTTTFDGGAGGGGTKRRGDNTYDAFRAGSAVANSLLRFDFDNGQAAQNALGGPGLGANEGFSSRGDSGGPGFIFNNNEWQLASVVSFTEGPPAQDINTYVDDTGAQRRDNSFGEINAETFANAHAANFINPTLAGNFDLVLDMNQQVLGNDGLTENLTIIVRVNAGNLEIEVVNNSAPGVFAGIYYSGPLAQIQSLTLRGAGDNETFRIEGDLGLNLTVAGRGGTDTLQVLNTTATYTPDATNLPSQGTLNAYGDNTIQFTGFEFVTPVAPDVTSSSLSQTTIDEDGSVTLNLQFIDPGLLSSHAVTVDWGDGTTETINLAVGARSFSRAHTYLDDNPTGTPQDVYTVQVTVRDNDDLTDAASTQVTVKNVAPVITSTDNGAAQAVKAKEGEAVEISGFFTDVGTLDTHTVSIDWGDGTVTPGAVNQGSGSGTFAGSHAYASGGIFTVTITLADDDTGVATAVETVFITGAGVQTIDGKQVLFVIGTNGADQVHVAAQGGGTLTVHAGFLLGGQRSFVQAVDEIRIFLCAGDDRGTIAASVLIPALLDGGAGDDFLNAGGAGAVLLGGPGNDTLIGSKANDVLIGGTGTDRLVGNSGEDILIGGFTGYDFGAANGLLARQAALLSILAEWNSSRSLAERRANINGTGVGPRLNGDNFLQYGVNVFDDGESDKLTGSAGEDWFFLFDGDIVTDFHDDSDVLN